MLAGLDHAVVAVADLDAATAAYATLLGRAPSWRGRHHAMATRNTLFRLENTYLELLAAEPGGSGGLAGMLRAALGERVERPFALALAVADLDAAVRLARQRGLAAGEPAEGAGADDQSGARRTWRSAVLDPAGVRGLRLFLIQHTSAADLLPPAHPTAAAAGVARGVDHVVIFTADLEAATALWVDVFGLSVAWRHDFPARRTRNLGLDLGGIVVELIQRTDGGATRARPDVFWGVAYRVDACAAAAARLRAAGVEVDAPRAGLAAGTRVATVRWPRTPTLLLEPQGGPPAASR